MTQTAQLRRTTLSTDAFAAVRAMLLDPARFQPGQKLSVEELARELGVSRSPIWAAIARLEAEGLVEVAPRRGVFLVGFDPDRLRDLFETREALEGMAARLAAGRITPGKLESLASIVREQAALLERGDRDAYAEAALAFHEGVLSAAANSVIERQLVSIYSRGGAMCRGRPMDGGLDGLRANLADHAELVDALRQVDADRAETVARRHIQRLYGVIIGSSPPS